MNNKKGWIEIIEAFTAMLLIVAVILILLNKGYSKTQDLSDRAYDTEIAILREIELDTDLRIAILSKTDEEVPVSWDDENFPPTVLAKIQERTPNPFTCVGMICNTTELCKMEGLGRKEIYVQSVIIGPTPGAEQRSRRLKLFCYS